MIQITEYIEFLKKELQNKTENETMLIKTLCNVIAYVLISITVISCFVVISYFWSPQYFDEYNNDSKNLTIEGGEK